MNENRIIAGCLLAALENVQGMTPEDFVRIGDAVAKGEVDNLSPDALKAWIGELVIDTFHSHAEKVLGGQK